jgi:branched-chain amino acid transport system permease protein
MRTKGLRIAAPVVAALIVALLPLVMTDRFLLKVFTYAGLNVLVVTGLALLFGYAGQVSLGHAAFVGLGAYTCAILTTRFEVAWPLAFVAAGAVAALGGLLLALPSLRLKGHYLAMATLGFGELMTLAFVEAVPLTGGVDGFTGIPVPTIGAVALKAPAELYWLVWGVAGVAIFLAGNMVSLRPGRAMRAMHGSELGATACGVDLVGIKLYASVIGFISPSVFTLSASVAFLAMAVIGGSSSLAGPVAAAIVLTLVQYLDALVPGISRETAQLVQTYEADVYGLAIVLIVLFAPGGIGALFKPRSRAGERA